MHICVIGAGVVGATTAFYLRQQGYKVSLVEAANQPAAGCSAANGGQLSYSYVAPLAAPGVMGDAIKWMFRSDSPLRFRPQLSVEQVRWLWHFWRACSSVRSQQTLLELSGLALLSRQGLQAIQQQYALSFQHQSNGKLIVHRHDKSFSVAKALVEQQAKQGAQQAVLSPDECIALEPELKGSYASLVGGVYTPSEEVGDCRAFTQALIQTLQDSTDFSLYLNCPVSRIHRQGGKIVGVETTQGVIQADQFVVAAGIDSVQLLRPLGIRLPLAPLKGYSLSIPTDQAGMRLSTSVTDYARRIVYANLGSSLRIAGLIEIGSADTNIAPHVIQRLAQQSTEAFPQLRVNTAQAWAGLRPATAQGKPIIDRAPGVSNLWLNVGQGALGFTLACGSAQQLSALITGQSTPLNPAAFSYTQVR